MRANSAPRSLSTLALVLALATGAVGPTETGAGGRRAVEGTVYDASQGTPLAYATIQVAGSGRSTLTNDDGRYRLWLEPGENRLRFSHIAFYSQEIEVLPGDSAVMIDVRLLPSLIEVGGMRVYGRQYDEGQRIIVEAIRRKNDILNRVHDYRYDAYTRLVIYDRKKPDTSAQSLFLIAESQTTAYWEQPDKYKEVITSRRQSANIPAEGNLVTVGQILNFNSNRIDLGRYSVVTPTAVDALDHYNYYLMDTLYYDSVRVFRLEVEPQNPDHPLFEGYIHIADSTYDVVAVDVGFSRGVEFPMVSGARYAQRFARFENDYWMPVEIRLELDVDIDMPLPGVPNKLHVAHLASLHDFDFDTGHPGGTFDEYLIEVADRADAYDSAAWQSRQTVPLTDLETRAYRRIDSLEHRPQSVPRVAGRVLAAAAAVFVFGREDIFRFDRVEGLYLGLGMEKHGLFDRLDLRLKGGYAFSAEKPQGQIGLSYSILPKGRLALGVDYISRIAPRPTVVSYPGYNPAFWAVLDKSDPYDYLRMRGFQVTASGKLAPWTWFALRYRDFEHRSMPVNNSYSVFDGGEARPNPPVTEGDFRSVTAELSLDTRPMFWNKGRARRLDPVDYFSLTVGTEYASPDLFDSDFNFRRYYASAVRRFRPLGLGITACRLYAGTSERDLPPQRFYIVDFGSQYVFDGNGFNTLRETNFAGDRVLSLSMRHNFMRRIWTASGLPLVRDIPLWLSVHGGIFWTEFKNRPGPPEDDHLLVAERPYRELGFGLGNLTPFLTPLNLTLCFTWQLSHYDRANDFSIDFGFEL